MTGDGSHIVGRIKCLRMSCICSRASRAREALRRGARWIVNTTAGLYRDDHPPGELSTA